MRRLDNRRTTTVSGPGREFEDPFTGKFRKTIQGLDLRGVQAPVAYETLDVILEETGNRTSRRRSPRAQAGPRRAHLRRSPRDSDRDPPRRLAERRKKREEVVSVVSRLRHAARSQAGGPDHHRGDRRRPHPALAHRHTKNETMRRVGDYRSRNLTTKIHNVSLGR